LSSTAQTAEVPGLWSELSPETQSLWAGHLVELYGAPDDVSAFEQLAQDKREALMLLHRRLRQLDLWKFVGRIVNVYGTGGVGMYFSAEGDLESELRSRRTFTRKFARHSDNSGGFIEKRRRRASLHFLYIDPPQGNREWHVHLDLYGPWGSPLSIAKHLRYEHWGTFRPDWRMIKEFVAE
jgi:hypothetical protein